MKKNFFIFALVLLMSLFLNTLNANAGILPFGIYAGVRGGAGMGKVQRKEDVKLDAKNSPFVSAQLGVNFFDFRGEVEYLFQYKLKEIKAERYSKNISPTVTMLNLYYDFLSIPFVKLFVNGGVGYKVNMHTRVIEDQTDFAYNVGGGVTFSLLGLLCVDAGYKYIDLGEGKIYGDKYRFNSHVGYVGLRVGF